MNRPVIVHTELLHQPQDSERTRALKTDSQKYHIFSILHLTLIYLWLYNLKIIYTGVLSSLFHFMMHKQTNPPDLELGTDFQIFLSFLIVFL